MGCGASKSHRGGLQGNLLVDGFLRYIQGTSGWTKAKGSAAYKAIGLEEYNQDAPLGTWRGSIVLEHVALEDVLGYVKHKLGTDEYELLEADDDSMIFRETFDFEKFAASGGKAHHTIVAAGDHRGEASDHMEDRITSNSLAKRSISKPPRSSALGVVSESVEQGAMTDSPSANANRALEDDVSDDGNDDEDTPAGSTRRLKRASAGGPSARSSGGVADDSVEFSEDGLPLGPETTAALENGENPNHQHPASLQQLRKRSLGSTWATRLLGSSRAMRLSATSRRGMKPPGSQIIARFPNTREVVFRRQDFSLPDGYFNTTRHLVICESTKYKLDSKREHHATRCQMRMMGALIEHTQNKRKTSVKVTFMISMDPELTEAEEALATPEALSAFGGGDRVTDMLVTMRDFFASESNRLILKFRGAASAPVGELGWEESERSKNVLQLGTNVQHPKLGHGVVQSFDMLGRVRVVYDTGERRDHTPEEKDDLRVAVIIGTRVNHPTRGPGTVKQFDEIGRIHVKFDNGEYHRYKQPAWKKKMHQYKLTGIGGALGTVKLSWRPFESSGVREGQGRVKFAVGVPTIEVLEFILDMKEIEEKSKTVLERRVLEVVSENERILYELRNMPDPIQPRDFVFREIWHEVSPKTYVVVQQSIVRPDMPEKPGIVRGEIHLSGWLIEPLFLSEESFDGEDHISKLTYQICMDIRGFIHPNAVTSVRHAILIGQLTDVRQAFWRQSQLKAKAKIANRKSKRMSGFGPSIV